MFKLIWATSPISLLGDCQSSGKGTETWHERLEHKLELNADMYRKEQPNYRVQKVTSTSRICTRRINLFLAWLSESALPIEWL